jgi:hypothetical protein
LPVPSLLQHFAVRTPESQGKRRTQKATHLFLECRVNGNREAEHRPKVGKEEISPKSPLIDPRFELILRMLCGNRVPARLDCKKLLWAAAGSVDTDLSFLSFLKVYRTGVAHR